MSLPALTTTLLLSMFMDDHVIGVRRVSILVQVGDGDVIETYVNLLGPEFGESVLFHLI